VNSKRTTPAIKTATASLHFTFAPGTSMSRHVKLNHDTNTTLMGVLNNGCDISL
jgi:hypothetical protein